MQHRSDEQQRADDLKAANERLIVMALREQEHAERERRSAAQVRALLESMSEGVTIFDAAGGLVSVNSCARKLLDLPAAPLLDDFLRLDLRRRDGSTLDFAQDAIARLLRGESFTDEEVVLHRGDGAERSLLVSGSAVREDDGGVVLAFQVLRDVTELRELEQMREQYLSLITHDLRGPLTAARMAAELLLGPPPDPERLRRLATRIIDNITRTDAMVTDLLDAQRIRAGKSLQLHREDCDVGALVRDVVADLVTVYGDRFIVQLDGDVRGWFSPRELRRAIWNLAVNGVKYGAPDRPIIVNVHGAVDAVMLAVHNEGAPIPASEVPRLFVPYARARTADERGPRGWGLGLTLVRGCAEGHGGRVTVHSDAASGTTFVIELPRAPSPLEPGLA